MTIQQLADAYIGHPEEIGEDSVITAQRESFKCGALRALQEIENILAKEGNDYLAIKYTLMKIIELKGDSEI